MKMTSPYAIGFALGVAVSWPVYCSAQSTKLVVTEGHYIGYPTVAGAMAALTAQGLVAVPGPNGDVSIVEPDNERAWIFAGKDNPAYPSAVRYVYTRSIGELHAELTILCEAAAERCAEYHTHIRDNLSQLARKMAGDPSAQCSVKDSTMKCGAEPDQTPSNP
jgi:hypothetical protein